jgi:hypothetical protein
MNLLQRILSKINSPRDILSNIVKVAFIWCAASIFYLFTYFGFIKQGNYVIFITASSNRIGENELLHRTVASAKKLGWSCYYHRADEDIITLPVIKWIPGLLDIALSHIIKPDLVLVLNHHAKLTYAKPSYLYINIPPDFLISPNDQFMLPYLKDFTGYIDLNLYGENEDKETWLTTTLAKENKKDYLITKGIFAIPDLPPYKHTPFNKLMIFGSNWGDNRKSIKSRKLILNLANQGLLDAYGSEKSWGFLGKFYKGGLHGNGLNTINKIKEYGAMLCFHTSLHLEAGIPTNRIFEAVAAGSIAISDRNPFIVREFGSNVLYVDANASLSALTEQVKHHLNWIKNHPKESEAMTRKAYDITMQKFTIESSLLKLKEINERFKKQKFTGRILDF